MKLAVDCILTERLRSWLDELMRHSEMREPIPTLAFAYLEGEEKSALTIVGLFEKGAVPHGEGRGIVSIGGVEFFYNHPEILQQLEGNCLDIVNGRIVVLDRTSFEEN